ncbi:MAG: amidohydrolase family protein [Nitrospinota bacterium]
MSSASGPENGNRAEQTPSRRQNLWRADLVCPAGSPPIRGGAVLTRGGRIEAVGPEAEVRPKGPPVPERNFGRAVLVPGLVNTHTHLELSGFEAARAPMAEWIVALVRETRGWPPPLFLSSSRLGAIASFGSGVTCVGDISASGHSRVILSFMEMRGVVFSEVLGLAPAEADSIVRQRLPSADGVFETGGETGGGAEFLRDGVSPHAPYTTSIPLYRLALEEARGRTWPSATHLAESPEEVRFLKDGGGAFAEMHKALESAVNGFDPPGCSPVRYLADAGVLEDIDLAVHCNQTDEEDWELLTRAGAVVCLCPRSTAYFGHPFADAAGMRRAGLRLCLGTDSRASSPSLSLLDEAAALWEADPGLTADALLEICTVNGAGALGFADEGVGRLTSGGVADFAVIAPPPGAAEVALADIFRPGAIVRTTVSGGIVRFDRGD